MLEDKRSPTSAGNDPDRVPDINTGDGAYVGGDVITGGGHFVGRDLIIEETTYDVHGLPNPYLGLRSFTYADQEAYAGRRSLIEQAVEKIANPEKKQSLTFVTGASGSGKSSFVQAGLVPALEVYYKQRQKTVSYAIMHPSSNPEINLGDALDQLGIPRLPEGRPESKDSFDLNAHLNLHTSAEQVNLVVIDQFEELFTQSSAIGRDLLIGLLSNLAPYTQIKSHFIVTLRSDYLIELFDIKSLWDQACRGIELRAMSVEEMGEAIQRPLQNISEHDERYLHKTFESSLIENLSQDASEEATYLPLLQVTLEELWRMGKLKLENYQGLTTAISQRADKVHKYSDYNDPDPTDERPVFEKDQIMEIFCDLVSVSLDDLAERDVRRSRTCRELESISRQRKSLIEDLIQARLLSVHLEISGSERIENVGIIHDSLIQNWQLLKDSIKEKRNQLKRRKRFEQELSVWVSNDFPDTHLLIGIHLREAEEMINCADIAMQTELAREFVTQSVQSKQVRQGRIIFWRNLPAGSTGGGIGFSLACIFIFSNQRVGEFPILIIAGLIIYFLVGLFSVGLITSLGITITQIRSGTNSRLVQWIIGGLGGIIGFSTAVIFVSLFGSTQGENSFGLVLVEGILWGSASGLSITWAMSNSKPRWLKLVIVCLLGGSALIIGEFIGKAFLFQNPVTVPAFWQIFIAGAIVPAGILTGLSLVNRKTFSKEKF